MYNKHWLHHCIKLITKTSAHSLISVLYSPRIDDNNTVPWSVPHREHTYNILLTTVHSTIFCLPIKTAVSFYLALALCYVYICLWNDLKLFYPLFIFKSIQQKNLRSLKSLFRAPDLFCWPGHDCRKNHVFKGVANVLYRWDWLTIWPQCAILL